MRIALDAMGGDAAPGINVDGALAAVESNPDLQIRLVGIPDQLEPLLSDKPASEQVQIVPATDVVGMEEKPTDALRKKPDSSIAVCWKLMAAREVDAVVSAGNTGAVVAAGLRTRLFLKGIKRPGIAVILPTLRGRAVLMDVGANPGARPEHLFQYGVVGSLYARDVLGVESPKIGLMNIGSEEGKGTEPVRETHGLFRDSKLADAYIGNVEGRDLFEGAADVVICEGFVGNVVLKVCEGMAGMLLKMVAGEVMQALTTEKEAAGVALQNLARRYHYNEVGGAPLLGIDGICLICHGSSDARSIGNALHGAAKLQDMQINQQIAEALAQASGES